MVKDCLQGTSYLLLFYAFQVGFTKRVGYFVNAGLERRSKPFFGGVLLYVLTGLSTLHFD